MTLKPITAARGGDLYAAGRRASIPAPGHSRHDRSASLAIGRSGKVIAHSFGSSTAFEILDDLRAAGLIDSHGFPTDLAVPHPRPYGLSDHAKRRRAVMLWGEAQAISGTLSERHLRIIRAIGRPLDQVTALRHHPACPLSIYSDGRSRRCPALLALVTTPDGSATAIEITYLDGQGRRNDAIRLSRKTVGVLPPGAAVRLDPIQATLVVGEGVVTALSASELLGHHAAALLSAGNLSRWLPPKGVTRLIIAADRGRAGEAAALGLSALASKPGIATETILPPTPHGDFNDWLRAFKARKEKGEGRGG